MAKFLEVTSTVFLWLFSIVSVLAIAIFTSAWAGTNLPPLATFVIVIFWLSALVSAFGIAVEKYT